MRWDVSSLMPIGKWRRAALTHSNPMLETTFQKRQMVTTTRTTRTFVIKLLFTSLRRQAVWFYIRVDLYFSDSWYLHCFPVEKRMPIDLWTRIQQQAPRVHSVKLSFVKKPERKKGNHLKEEVNRARAGWIKEGGNGTKTWKKKARSTVKLSSRWSWFLPSVSVAYNSLELFYRMLSPPGCLLAITDL